jgi:hypothetical protein
MAIIQLKGEVANSYRSFLESYRTRTGKEPTAIERTEAFACAVSKDPWKRPHWIA